MEVATMKFLIILTTLILAGCGGSGSKSPYSGTWFGIWTAGPMGGSIDMAVEQDGHFIAHHFNTDTQTYQDEMQGVIEGNQIRGQLGHEFFEGTVRLEDGLLKVQVWQEWVMSRR